MEIVEIQCRLCEAEVAAPGLIELGLFALFHFLALQLRSVLLQQHQLSFDRLAANRNLNLYPAILTGMQRAERRFELRQPAVK